MVPPCLSAHEYGTACSASLCLTCPSSPATTLLQSSLPGCLSLPLLTVWLNVSSLTLVVGLPYSLIFCQFWLFFLIFKFVVVLLSVVWGGRVYLPMTPYCLEVLGRFFLKNNYLFICREEDAREKEGEKHQWERITVIGCLLYVPQPEIEFKTQACVLTGNWTGNISLCGRMPNLLNHTSQGSW